jgi:drug/metabolite transporter (DMT)-like permease
MLAMCAAVLCFSLASVLIRKAGAPGPTIAFWRMVGSTTVWTVVLWISERRRLSLAEYRRALVPGIVLGVNLMAFFTGVTKTSIANAEFIGALTPIVLVPAGALLFNDRINPKALLFGLISLTGLALVLFNAPARGDASWLGNGMVVAAMTLWASYLLLTRWFRGTQSVAAVLAGVMPIATLTILPVVLWRGEATAVTARGAVFIGLLVIVTGTLAQGLIQHAQQTVPVGTIGLLQVAQPALSVTWAAIFLDQLIRPIQIVGMALVMAGLVAIVTYSQRGRATLRSSTETRGARRKRRAERVVAATDPST